MKNIPLSQIAYIILFLIIAASFSPAYGNLSLLNTSVEDYIRMGILEYQNNNFDIALNHFQAAENKGLSNPDLYFNIANCFYRLNNIAYSIVYYKKALLLNSAHREAKQNLDFMLSITRDKQIDLDEGFMNNLMTTAFYSLSINSLLSICLILLMVLVLNIHIQWFFVNLDRTILRFVNFVLLFLLLGLSGLVLSRVQMVNKNNEAVVVENTVYVYSGPNESFTRLFSVHEGTVLRINREEADWVQITTLSGFSGWINSNVFVRIKD